MSLRGGKRGGDLVGVMREIIHHGDAARLAHGLKAPADALERAKRRDHVGKRHVERAAGGDGRKRVGDIVPARHRQAEANLLDLKAASRGPELDGVPANIGARPEAEAERAAGKRIEILVLADHEGLARARAQHGEHLRHLRHLLVVALEIEDDADGGRVAHERAVALIGLDDEEV